MRNPAKLPDSEDNRVDVFKMKKYWLVGIYSAKRANIIFYHETFHAYKYFDERQRDQFGNVWQKG